MIDQDLIHVRTALIITLGVLLVFVLVKRMKRAVILKDVPAPMHAELLTLHVAYHPSRLLVELHIPKDQTITSSLLDSEHRSIHEWGSRSMAKGENTIELPLEQQPDGAYYLQLSTATQRTIRQFRLQNA